MLSDQELLNVSREVGPDNATELAASLEMLQKLESIRRDPTLQNQPVLNLLYEWKKAVGNREVLASALQDIKLPRIAHM